MTKKKLHHIASILGLLLLAPIVAHSQEFSARMIQGQVLPGEPIQVEVRLTADVPDGQIWVSSTNFRVIQVEGPAGACKERPGEDIFLRNPYSPWYRHDVQLSGHAAQWSQIVRLDSLFYLEEPGIYKVTVSWKSAPLDEHGARDVKKTLEVKSPEKAFRYLTAFQATKKMEFQLVEPTGVDKEAFNHFKGAPLADRKGVIARFPTSSYAAYALWAQGFSWYQDRPEIGAERDFNADSLQRNQCSPLSYKSWREQEEGIIQPWEQLYHDFPSFSLRPELLYGLSRCYFRIGEPLKAVPLLKELQARFPDSEPAKKGASYKDVLVQHQLWPKE